jgi:putative phosphoribosyl transferase
LTADQIRRENAKGTTIVPNNCICDKPGKAGQGGCSRHAGGILGKEEAMSGKTGQELSVQVEAAGITLEGDLAIPEGVRGLVLFAHGSGSSRHSSRNRYVARVLREAGLGTLLFDLLTSQEEQIDARTRRLRFDIGLLADRVTGAVDWLRNQEATRGLALGIFGASTGAAAALVAAARRPLAVRAVVSRGGRPDLAGDALPRVQAPTLLIVGGDDEPVIELNEQALRLLGAAEKKLVIVPGATHLFEEPGTLEEVARLAAEWFARHLAPAAV